MITETDMAEAVAARVDLVAPTILTPAIPADGWTLPKGERLVTVAGPDGPVFVRVRIEQQAARFGAVTYAVTGAWVDENANVHRVGDDDSAYCITHAASAAGYSVEELKVSIEAAERTVVGLTVNAIALLRWQDELGHYAA